MVVFWGGWFKGEAGSVGSWPGVMWFWRAAADAVALRELVVRITLGER